MHIRILGRTSEGKGGGLRVRLGPLIGSCPNLQGFPLHGHLHGKMGSQMAINHMESAYLCLSAIYLCCPGLASHSMPNWGISLLLSPIHSHWAYPLRDSLKFLVLN